MPITFSSPWAQPEVVYFLFQMKAHIFLIANLKFRLQTPCSFENMTENVKLTGIPINNILCIYIIASSPGLHTLFCLWRVNKKLPQGETSQNTFQRSRSISWECKIHIIIIIIYGICNAPLPKDTKRRQQYNKNKQNRLRIKVSFKMRLEYGNRGSTADVNGDGVPFQGSSHWKGSVTGTFVASRNPEVETVVSACLNRAHGKMGTSTFKSYTERSHNILKIDSARNSSSKVKSA